MRPAAARRVAGLHGAATAAAHSWGRHTGAAAAPAAAGLQQLAPNERSAPIWAGSALLIGLAAAAAAATGYACACQPAHCQAAAASRAVEPEAQRAQGSQPDAPARPKAPESAAAASSSEGSGADAEALARGASVHRWLAARGADEAAVRIAPSQQAAGLGLVASEQLRARARPTWWQWLTRSSADVRLAALPLDLVVTARTPLGDARLGPAYRELLDLEVVDERTLVILFLLLERLRGQESQWAPWLAALPAAFDTPLHWTPAELRQLRGTALHAAAELKRKQLEEQWRRLQPAAADLARQVSARQPDWTDFLWAYSTFWSRAQSLPLPGSAPDGRPSPHAADAEVWEGIVPGLDFANHSSTAAARWTIWGAPAAGGAPPDSVQLVAPRRRAPAPGAEVTINYGDKSNEELLFLYGFVEEGNPNDLLMIRCPLPPPDQWTEGMHRRLALLRARGLRPQLFLPALDAPARSGAGGKDDAAIPPAVWDTLEAFVMEPAELDAELARLQAAAAGGADGGGAAPASGATDAGAAAARGVAAAKLQPTDLERSGLRMAVLTTLVRLLELTAAGLEDEGEGTGPLEADQQRLQQGGLSARERAALVYRSGQKQIAHAWLARARGELNREVAHMRRLLDKP